MSYLNLLPESIRPLATRKPSHSDIRYRYYYKIHSLSKQLTSNEITKFVDQLKNEITQYQILLAQIPIIWETFEIYPINGNYYLEIEFRPDEMLEKIEYRRYISKVPELVIPIVEFELNLTVKKFSITGKLIILHIIRLKDR